MVKKIVSMVIVTISLFSSHVFAENSFQNSSTCSDDLQMTQNLKAPGAGEGYVRNGRYHWYTKTTVREAHILQKHLNRLGFDAGVVDGVIGPNTKGAILRMQEYLGTKQDGYVGPKTRTLLNNSCESDDAWEEKYDQEDVALSKKAYTDNYAYSDYAAGNFAIDTEIKITDKNTQEYAHIDISAGADTAINIPELEMMLDMEFSYDVDTNHTEAIYDFEQWARGFNLDYKDFLKGELQINAVMKDLDAYIKIADVPNFYWDSIENELDVFNEISDKTITIRDIKKYEDEWIKIEMPQDIKEFAKLMIKSILPEMRKQSLDQAKIYRENPFIIIDESSKSRSGSYYSYNATIDIDNLVRFSEQTDGSNGDRLTYGDIREIKDLIRQNYDVLKDIEFKVYLDTKTDELRKISFIIDADLDQMDKNIEMEIFLDFEFETTHISNTKKNDIGAPRNAEKWEDIFEDIFGKTFEEIGAESLIDYDDIHAPEIPTSEYEKIEVTANDHIYGDDNAKISIFEYGGFNDPFSQRFHETPLDIVDNYSQDVNFIFRHFPLEFQNPSSYNGAIASECVASTKGDAGFYKAYRGLFTINQDSSTLYDIVSSQQYIDKVNFDICYENEQTKFKVEHDVKMGTEYGIVGTPSVYVQNNRTGEVVSLPGAVPYEMVLDTIEQVL